MPFIIAVSFVLTTLAVPAQAVNPMRIQAGCDNGPGIPFNQGVAAYAVYDREANTTVSLAYDNGYTVANADGGARLWYTFDTVEPQQSADSVLIKVANSTSGATLLEQTFNRHPKCGERPGTHLPVAEDVTGSVPMGGQVTLAFLGSDPNPDDSLSYFLVTSPAHGTVNDDDLFLGQLIYTPEASFVGTESFIYAVEDGYGNTAEASVTIQVTNTQQVAPAAPAFQQVSMTTGKGAVTLSASASVNYRVYTIHNPGTPEEWSEDAVKTGTYEFPAGVKVRVVAEPASGSVVLTGTTEWVRRTYLVVTVKSTENAVSVYNPNPVPVRLSWSGFSTVVTAKTTRVIATTAPSITWSAKSELDEYVANGATVVRQVRPKAKITLNCRGSREITSLLLDNRASNVPVKFDFKIGGVWGGKKVVAARASFKVTHKGHLKPGRKVYVYAWTNNGKTHKLIKVLSVPRGC